MLFQESGSGSNPFKIIQCGWYVTLVQLLLIALSPLYIVFDFIGNVG